IPAMLRSGGGAIVNNSSVGGHIGFPGSSVYVASKFAVIGLTKTVALEFARQGIRVNSVSPGPIQTEMFDRAFGEGETDMNKTIATQTPGWPHRHSGGDCQRRALAQFTRCGVRDRPRHHRGRWIHRTIAENNRSGGDAMAPAMISVGGAGHCNGTLRKQIAMACFRFVLTML